MAPLIHQMSIGAAFNDLSSQEKLYAHHLAKAAWHGTRIILRQVSPESNGIFDLIVSLYELCQGDWEALAVRAKISAQDAEGFLECAATFLSNIGNYYGSGDQKFTPTIPEESMARLAYLSDKTAQLWEEIRRPLFSKYPACLGFPGDNAQSAYYPQGNGLRTLPPEEIRHVSRILDKYIFPENTRLCGTTNNDGSSIYKVLQASVTYDASEALPNKLSTADGERIALSRGDHSVELEKVCESLKKAAEYAANDQQRRVIQKYVESFTSGDLEQYRESQRLWVKDLNPKVENIFGFVEPYRDPAGTRAEFEGLVAISNTAETELLKKLAGESSRFIRKLPWTIGYEDNDGKGPFERDLFEPPDFTSIHSLAYCSSIIFPGVNLPNYNDIRHNVGFKNVIIANRMAAESNTPNGTPFVDDSESERFLNHKFVAYYIWVVLHELLGHGTSKLLAQVAEDNFNFDIQNPPVDPTTGQPINSWYSPGQTWTGVFGDIATTIDECRAELVGAYLMDDKELLGLFGYTDNGSGITADDSMCPRKDVTYNIYLQLGVDGLRGLEDYDVKEGKWGQAHSQAHFATLKHLYLNGNSFLDVQRDSQTNKITVSVDRSRIIQDGKPALGQMLLKLHMYRCTANVDKCRPYYEDLSRVDGEYLEWRRIVLETGQPKWLFSQPNTLLKDEVVTVKEYEPTSQGVIQSWAERCI